jgi:hypothetical protein
MLLLPNTVARLVVRVSYRQQVAALAELKKHTAKLAALAEAA